MIELENVSFSYDGQEHDGLHDINLKILDGECVLFCGRSAGVAKQRLHAWSMRLISAVFIRGNFMAVCW